MRQSSYKNRKDLNSRAISANVDVTFSGMYSPVWKKETTACKGPALVLSGSFSPAMKPETVLKSSTTNLLYLA